MFLVLALFFGLLAIGLPVGFVIGVAGMVGILEMGPRFMTMAPSFPSWQCRSSSSPVRS
jgi:hypothetical protein